MEYFIWLCEKIDNGETQNYTDMLYLLHSIDFRYSVYMDENRLIDGLDLRNEHHGLVNINPCSVLEMFVALSEKCEHFIMDNGEVDRTSSWFWLMMINLGLDMYDNNNYNEESIRDIIDTFLDRTYLPNGYGGAFITMDTQRDMRDIELWVQLNMYINENNLI